MEAGKHGLTRGARFVAVCLEVIAVAGLMWVSWCVFGGAAFFFVFRVFAIKIIQPIIPSNLKKAKFIPASL